MKEYPLKNSCYNIAIQAVLFISGAVALTFELLWNRMLYPVLGMHLYATTAVLISFMFGLGLGSYIFGILGARARNPFRMLGYICIATGILGIIFPFIINIVQKYILSLIPLEIDPVLLNITRLSASILILILPCTLMGGAFPICARFLGITGVINNGLPSAYSIYTGGAVFGSLITGLVLIPMLGMTTIGAAAGLLVTAVGVLLLRVPSDLIPDIDKHSPKENSGKVPYRSGKRAFLIILFVTGFTTLSLEILWARSLTQILGGTYTNFAVILSGVLTGIWLGSAVYSKYFLKKFFYNSIYFLVALLLISIAGTFIFLPFVPVLMQRLIQGVPGDYAFFGFVIRISLTLLIILPASFILGIIFPHVLRLFSEDYRDISRSVGIAMAVNTLGAICGVFFTGLVFIGFLGTGSTLKLLLTVNILLIPAFALFYRYGGKNIKKKIIAVAAAVFLALSVNMFFPEELFYSNQLAGLRVRIPGEKTVLFKGEDEVSMAAVIEENDSLLHYVDNGTVRSGTQRDIYHSNWRGVGGTHLYHWNITWAYLPCLIHPDPKKVLVIGYGTGRQTASIATFRGIEKIDVVEINPLNITASSFFYIDAPNLFSDPRVNLYIEDGRNFLMRTDTKYDIIIVDVGGLYADGSEFFYTKEFLNLMYGKLAPEGMALTWLSYLGFLSEAGWRYQKTINSVFGRSTLWMGGRQDFHKNFMWVISTKKVTIIDYEKLKKRWMNLTAHQYKELYLAGIKKPEEMFSLYLTSLENLPERIKKEKILTDNNPYYIMPWEKGLPEIGKLMTTSFLSDPAFYNAGYGHIYFDRDILPVKVGSSDIKLIRKARELQLQSVREDVSVQVQESLEANLKAGKITEEVIKRYLSLTGDDKKWHESNIVTEAIKKILEKK